MVRGFDTFGTATHLAARSFPALSRENPHVLLAIVLGEANVPLTGPIVAPDACAKFELPLLVDTDKV